LKKIILVVGVHESAGLPGGKVSASSRGGQQPEG